MSYGPSSINPYLPATDGGLSSQIMRNQFTAAYSDINTIYAILNAISAGEVIGNSAGSPAPVSAYGATTGLYSTAAGNVGVSVLGTNAGQWTSSGMTLPNSLTVGGSVSVGSLNVNGQSLIIGGNTTFSGAYTFTGTLTGNTSVTFPTSGTLATTAGSVASFSAGTTGLTPSSATTGAVTLAGTLNVAYGGTGLTSTTAYSILGNETSTAGGLSSSQSMILGTPSITDSGIATQLTGSLANYYQSIWQNTSNGVASSTDIVVNNNLGTATTYYANLGINSSAFSGSGSFNIANASYLTSTSGDLSLGTTTSNAIHLVVNSGSTDAVTISSAGVASFANTITGSVSGSAATVTGATQTAITTLSNLTTVGTIGTGTWQGSIISGQYGGTGVANNGKTITLGGNLTTSGAYAVTLTATNTTSITLPTTGTISALGNAQTWSALQTFTNSDIAILGSSTGYTTFTSANSSATNYTLTIPATTGTMTVLGNTTTGSGNIVLATSPTLVTPALGTPSSGTLTNCSGLPYNGTTNFPAFSASGTTVAVSTSTYTLAPYSTTTFDRATNYTNTSSNYKFTAPVAGVYRVHADCTLIAASGNNHSISIYKNGVSFKLTNYQLGSSGTPVFTMQTDSLMLLNANDYLQIYFFQDSGGSQTFTIGEFNANFVSN